ncbi:YtfJ family protein [Vibrio palustris]|uniref:YtfJ family protein n=1 Tax=Vibrio palustris TaxID=1918946 RepID=A0A1R4B422_9VIBR|nr:YtfJ family protein [Vibrio palustris]SJL83653.1 Bacterial protein of unknown function (YtfJ_HI0045) [Vibrio palustris]
MIIAPLHKLIILVFTWLNCCATFLRYLLTVATILFSSLGYTQTMAIGDEIPSVSVQHLGEIHLQQKQVVFSPWSSRALLGKVRIIQLVPGKADARTLNQHLIHAISRAEFDTTQYQTTTIINANDAFWGTEMFVKSSAMALKKQYSWMMVIFDENGQVAQRWHLTHHEQSTLVVDRKGKIKFIKRGRLDDHTINTLIHITSDLIHH